MKNRLPEIFFHVGLGKVASTYLQYKFFPKLKGVHYVQRTKYRLFASIIPKVKADKVLFSREMDQQLEREAERFAADYPDTKTILLLRRHDSWIASQYRRYVKNGGPKSFDDFFDIKKDEGLWKHHDVNFYSKIQILEKHFDHKPLVLFHDELKENPHVFFQRLAGYIGATYNKKDISLSAIHKSYNQTQLKVIHLVSQFLFKKEPIWSDNLIINWFQRRSRLLACYLILYPALLVPKSWVTKEPLIPEARMKQIREAFDADWQKCLAYAKNIEEA